MIKATGERHSSITDSGFYYRGVAFMPFQPFLVFLATAATIMKAHYAATFDESRGGAKWPTIHERNRISPSTQLPYCNSPRRVSRRLRTITAYQ
jgi:hypothetical protein